MRYLLVAALAGGCATVLYARTYVAYERIRIQIGSATPPAGGGAVAVELPPVRSLAGDPASLVLWLENRDAGAREVTTAVNGVDVHRATLPGDGAARVDIRLPGGFQRAGGNTLTLTSPGDGWALRLLEFGNAYGFSRGALSFVIAPAGTSGYRSVPLWIAGLIGLALTAGSLVAYRPFRSRPVRFVHRTLATLVVIVFVLILVAPAVSIYTLLLSPRAFAWCLAILYLPVLTTLFVWSRPGVVRGMRTPVRLAVSAVSLAAPYRYRLLCLSVVALFLVSVAGFYDSRTGFTTFIEFGEQFEAQALPELRALPHAVNTPFGYDGQFYAQLALDPLTTHPGIEEALDTFGYRAKRILFAWTAYVLGLGQPRWILEAYALQNVLCWLILAALLLRWLPPVSLRNVLAWFGCLFSHGLIKSVVSALLEGPSLLLLVLAVIALERNRPWLTTGLAGLSGLGRETNLLSGVVLVRPPLDARALLRLGLQALLVGAPLVGWLAYLRLAHPDAEFPLEVVGNFAAPLIGYAGDWRGMLAVLRAEGWDSVARFDLMALVSVAVQLTFFAFRRDWRDPWYRAGAVYAILMLFLGPDLWNDSPGSFTRVLLPMTCAFNVLLVRVPGWRFWPIALLGNLTVLHGLEALQTPYIWRYL